MTTTKNWQFTGKGRWPLVTYNWEEQTFPEFRKIEIDRKRAALLIKKFSRHFKTSCPILSNRLTRGGGSYTPGNWNSWIKLPIKPSLALVCHEYAHHLEHTRHPDSKQWHGKTFRRELTRVYTFAKRYLPIASELA